MQSQLGGEETLSHAALPLGDAIQPDGIDFRGGQSAGQVSLVQRPLAGLVHGFPVTQTGLATAIYLAEIQDECAMRRGVRLFIVEARPQVESQDDRPVRLVLRGDGLPLEQLVQQCVAVLLQPLLQHRQFLLFFANLVRPSRTDSACSNPPSGGGPQTPPFPARTIDQTVAE